MDHDPAEIQKIVLPLMNVSRRMYNGEVNPKEPNGQTIYVTSASSKISYAYEKLIEILQSSILDPEDYIAMGCNYKVPLSHGLLNRDFVEQQRLSATYTEEAFANEYLSLFSAVSEDSWFNLASMDRYRTIKNPEKKSRMHPSAPDAFYLLSIDVGRLHDSTVCCVFKVFPRETHYATKLVNIIHIGLGNKTFQSQVIEIKRLIRDYNPREVVIDINGLGIGLGDLMIQEQRDQFGEVYPAYGFHNEKNYLKEQPKDAIQILYGIKASSELNSAIHGNVHSRLSSGKVRLLIDENAAKSHLMALKSAAKMSPIEREKRLLPHKMTTKLIYEMANLRLKTTGDRQQIVLERINARFPKDRYSAFSYGLWRIKELEEENIKKSRKRSFSPEDYVIFTPR